MGWNLIKEIHQSKLKKVYEKQGNKGFVCLGVDGLSIKKGHKYMTIFVNLQTGRIIHAVEGRSSDAVTPFVRKIKQKAMNLRAVAVNMSQSYVKALQENLSHIDIVFDLYHISALANRTIGNLRKEIQADLDREGKKYLFLHNYSNLTDDTKKKLQGLLDVNEPLCLMYNMKELLRYFWNFSSPDRSCRKISLFLVPLCDFYRNKAVYSSRIDAQ